MFLPGVSRINRVVFQACEDLTPGVVFLRKFGLQFLPELNHFSRSAPVGIGSGGHDLNPFVAFSSPPPPHNPTKG